MSTIQAKALVTVEVGATSRSYVDPQSDFDKINTAMLGAGLITRNYAIKGPGALGGIGNIITAAPTNWNLSAKVEVTQTYIDGISDDTDDVAISIRNAVYEVTGFWPTQFAVTVVNGKTVSEGIGEPGGGTSNPITGILGGIGDPILSFFSTLSKNAVTLLIVGVAIVILVLVLAAYGPNVKHIAAAARP